MYHSIQIIQDGYGIYKKSNNRWTKNYNGKNTWTDWHLIPSTRPLFNPPAPKTNYIDVPGMSGSIDLSTALSGNYPVFSDRTGSQEFYVMNGYKEWYNAYSDIMNYCHGQKVKIILEDEPSYYYLGRVSVNGWKSEKDWSKITLDFTVDPYKYELVNSQEPWIWDPFSFVDGIINPDGADTWTEAIYNSTTEVIRTVPLSSIMPMCPEFTITPLSTPGDNCKLTITLYRMGDRSVEQGGYCEEETHKVVTCTSSGSVNKIFYDMVMRDFRPVVPHSSDKVKAGLGFKCAAGASFKVSVKFRRGKL